MYPSLSNIARNLAVVIIAIVLVALFACKKELQQTTPRSSKHEVLKQWYLSSIDKSPAFLTSFVPDWSNANQTVEDDKTVFEFDCANPNKIIYGEDLLNNDQKEKSYYNTKVKLLIFVDKDNNKTAAFMIVKGNVEGKSIHYKVFPNFTGSVIYFSLSGIFANGWIYADGNILKNIHKVVDKESSDKQTMLADVGNCNVSAVPVYGQQCFTVYPIPEQGGSPYTSCTWVVIDVIYNISCPPGGDSPGPPSGGGGYEPPIDPPSTPEPAPDDPCAKAKKLNENTAYNNEATDLKNKVADNTIKREVGYIKSVGSPANFVDPGGTGLVFPVPRTMDVPNNSLQYINHTHYKDSKALSTFSFEDLETFSKYLASGKVEDIHTFTIGVTTTYGTYAFILDNWTQFGPFYQNIINSPSGYDALRLAFNSQATGIHENNSGAINEKNLLRILNSNNSGVKLLKKDANTGAFKLLSIDDNGNVITIDCAGGGIE